MIFTIRINLAKGLHQVAAYAQYLSLPQRTGAHQWALVTDIV